MSAAAITELTVESAPKAIFQEWLASYFDGATHDVGQTLAVAFPKATLAFDQTVIKQPLDTGTASEARAEIRVTCIPGRSRAWMNDVNTKLAWDEVSFNFWIRASAQDTAQARLNAQTIAELLFALMRNPDTRLLLSQKGVQNLAPRKPTLVSTGDYVMWAITCRAKLIYSIRF